MSEFPHEQHAREDRATAPAPDGTGDPTNRWLALLVCCSALFMTLLDVSITNVALLHCTWIPPVPAWTFEAGRREEAPRLRRSQGGAQ